MIGPLDWSLIESWQKRGIPLRIVLQGIDEVFDSFEQRNEDKTSVRSLKYCSDAVERRFAEWSSGHVGKPDASDEAVDPDAAFSDTYIRSHINELVEAFPALDTGVLKTVGEGLEIVLRELAAFEITSGSEEKLDRLDDSIDELLLANREALLSPELRNRIRTKLAAFGIDIDDAAAERVICWAIKEEYGIPRLSLFRL